MEIYEFDNIQFEGKSILAVHNKIRKYVKLKYGSLEEYHNGNKCYYSDNYTPVTLINKDNKVLIRYTNTKGAIFRCGKPECKCKKLNPLSLEFLVNCRGLSEIEAKSILSSKNKKSTLTSYLNVLDGKPGTAAAMSAAGRNPMSVLELNKRMSETETKEFLLTKGHKTESTKRSNGWYDDISNNPYSKTYWVNHGMSIEEAQYKVNSRNFWCKEFYQSRENSKLSNPSKLEYYVNKFGEELGQIKFGEKISKAIYSNSIESYIIRYGYIEGTRKYNSKIEKTTGNLGSISTESRRFFSRLYKRLIKIGYNRTDLQVGLRGSKEFVLRDELNNSNRYDCCLIHQKIIIEYNGHIWHPRRDRMTNTEWENWKMPFKNNEGISANDKEFKDLEKISFAKRLGYNIIEVWPKDGIENNLTKCMEIINEQDRKTYN